MNIKNKLSYMSRLRPDTSWLLPSIICAGFVALYILIIHFEYQHYLDDTWSVTQSYYYLKFGKEFDYLVGYSGLNIAHFAKTYAFVYGAWAELFGWGRIAHQVLSAILAWLGVLLWAKIFIQLGASRAMAISFAIILPLSVAFAMTATRTRGDSLVFLLGALAVWLAVHRYWFWATLVVLIAIETHPSGIIYCFYVTGIWLITNNLKQLDVYKQTVLQVIPAALLGIGYYLILHYDNLDTIVSTISGASYGGFWNDLSLKSYFWDSGRYRRHMLEFFLFVLSYIIVLWSIGPNRDKKTLLWKFVILCPAMILLADLMIARGSDFYAIHFYPPLIILSIYAWSKIKFPVYLFPLLVSLYMLPQYGYWVYKNANFYFPGYIDKVREHSKGIEPDVILGNYAHWFAFNNKKDARKFVVEEHAYLFDKIDGKYILWVNDYDRNNFINVGVKKLEKFKKAVSVCPKEEFSSFDYGGHHVRFEGYDCRGVKLAL